ncbi:MAG: nucleotide exchange factor GrpE [bacterium (Candidatus Ratteibacteria) CG_4_10_14_3_um_filter_41_18]|uniref:Protein GrpE n=4 Tax=Candidatus Ratteibacteria TaxID=2979319 RepID=A0A2M7E7Y0_9BACT|nr:MAG: nucleotide exchange factor GrpE [bacterium (Candidatus Ratteibacteria) CG01_land_8_20_14_3_00_40_19]PIW33698.1 MAG: nucleotide exchange factor GrpE [bacterium (Candidatus Ratteibacteria) CG15_BIG_FIL_POST_REV_8_21_14_020_41_12]PIX76907.1 MAG: nucleotide exchange factor GrpE [bacterium (Candidatus Ratteibacteria) CG_4_10_14_3_um_filter_41_18]PJA62227.1 MAG: nucleotide exchange factor GrpE [bacterium (Candidatus Ratteibacteria) CG_4_9_14_3_um_filter_41_21]
MMKERIVRLKSKDLEALRKGVEKTREYYEQLLRLSAEFDNFRKRQEKERQQFLEFSQKELLVKFLPVLDALENVLRQKNMESETLWKGFSLIQRDILAILASEGLQRQKVLGKLFDPLKHEAVETIDSQKHRENEIVEELRSGYLLKNKIIRPAMVKIARPTSK